MDRLTSCLRSFTMNAQTECPFAGCVITWNHCFVHKLDNDVSSDHPVNLRLPPAHCGIIGIYGRGSSSVSAELYEGLLMLQHRGQDSAGMVTTDWTKFLEHKGNGLVRDVFRAEQIAQMTGEGPDLRWES
jgi:hypothetical protein